MATLTKAILHAPSLGLQAQLRVGGGGYNSAVSDNRQHDRPIDEQASRLNRVIAASSAMTRRVTLHTYFTMLISDPLLRSKLKDSGRDFVFLITSVVCTGFFLLTVDNAMAQSIMSDVRTVVVQTGDLDLSRPAGQKTLANRIRSAERTICGSAAHGIEAMAAETKCVKSLRREKIDSD